MLKISNLAKLERAGTPFYYYDVDLLRKTLDELRSAAERYDIEVHYALKANVEKRILEMISSAGFGADCVSGNEILMAEECGFPASATVFAGVGKTDREIGIALERGIFALNCESLQEIRVIDEIAGSLGTVANVSVRINPDIDAHTHKYITTGLEDNKFGISARDFGALTEILPECRNINFNGLHFHIGSQITDVRDVFSLECRRVNEIVAWFEEKGFRVDNIDLGGGLGVDYVAPDDNPVPDFRLWLETLDAGIDRGNGRRIHIEPGRSLVAQCGSLITRVLYVKPGAGKTFLIADAGMNDLIRPALYGSYHSIENLTSVSEETAVYDIVGPVCESSDVWGENRRMPETARGDILAVRSAGAYGQVMASRYNLRDLARSVFSDEPDA